MINLVHAEFYKLYKSISFKLCFLIACISAAAFAVISHSIAVGSISTNISGSASGLSELVIIALLGSLLTGILVCNDFETKTIHDAVACGKGRRSIVISKVFIYVCIMFVLLVPYAAATTAGFCTRAEFTKPFVGSAFLRMLYDGKAYSTTAGNICKILLVSLTTVLVHAARLSICLPVAFKTRKPVAVTAIGFAYSALIDLVLGLLKDVPVLGSLISISPYNREFILMSFDTKADVIGKAVISSVVFLILITIITYYSFKKAEIK
jgi:hypothetical protein